MNGARHLPETLKSILEQAVEPFDLIIADDCSDDESLAIVRALCGDRARTVSNSDRLGLAGNWNQCVALSRTPLVAIVHQDDVLCSNHLQLHARAFATDPSVGLVASASNVIDDDGKEIPDAIVGRGGLGLIDHTFAPREALAPMAAGNPLRCSAVTLRARAHSDVGGFNPALRYVVDWDFWLRVAANWSLAWIASTTVDIRWHLASETHRFKMSTIDLEETETVLHRLIAELNATGVPTSPIKKQADRTLARAYLNRAHAMLKSGDARSARGCLKTAIRLCPGVVRSLATDPRLAARMLMVWASPASADSLFGQGS